MLWFKNKLIVDDYDLFVVVYYMYKSTCIVPFNKIVCSACIISGVTELLGALRRFLLGAPVTPLSIDIYFKNSILIVFTDLLGAP